MNQAEPSVLPSLQQGRRDSNPHSVRTRHKGELPLINWVTLILSREGWYCFDVSASDSIISSLLYISGNSYFTHSISDVLKCNLWNQSVSGSVPSFIIHYLINIYSLLLPHIKPTKYVHHVRRNVSLRTDRLLPFRDFSSYYSIVVLLYCVTHGYINSGKIYACDKLFWLLMSVNAWSTYLSLATKFIAMRFA